MKKTTYSIIGPPEKEKCFITFVSEIFKQQTTRKIAMNRNLKHAVTYEFLAFFLDM